MRTATAKGIRVLMLDDSRIAANSGHRVAGDRSVFDKGVYTACKPCADANGPAPLWQIKADRVTHDEVTHQIEYNDAWLEFGGIPVAYTPYMSHADPSIKRESGLLPPTVINNKIVGGGVRTPYFGVIDPYQDITLTPLITTNDYQQLAMMHRWRDIYGGTKTSGQHHRYAGIVGGKQGDHRLACRRLFALRPRRHLAGRISNSAGLRPILSVDLRLSHAAALSDHPALSGRVHRAQLHRGRRLFLPKS